MLVSYSTTRCRAAQAAHHATGDVAKVGQGGQCFSASRWTNPVLLETVLGAEEAVLDPQL